jgi:hypothetical protein
MTTHCKLYLQGTTLQVMALDYRGAEDVAALGAISLGQPA